jgi:hypothetical protein
MKEIAGAFTSKKDAILIHFDPFWASRHPGIPHFYANP